MPGKYYKYSKDALNNAIQAVKQGMPCATASKTYKVPRTTILYKVSGKYPIDCKSGVSTILTSDEENILARWIVEVGKTGFPVSKEQLLNSVALLIRKLKRETSFTNGRPGRHWYEGFLKRHPEISLRITQNLTSSRAAISELRIRKWFEEISNYFLESNICIVDPRRVFNSDEIGFSLAPKEKTALVMKGSKAVYNYANSNEKESITTLITGNAAGEMAPPMVMFAYERIPKLIIEKCPDDWGVGKSENGWMTSESFFEYIANVFHPWLLRTSVEFPVILYVDGHKSHLTLNLSEFCRNNNIILISLVPNATHILQPLDVGYFHPLKTKWREAICQWRIEHKKESLKKDHFAPLLKSCLEKINSPTIMKNAFRTCGLFPFSADSVDYSKCLASASTVITSNIVHKTAETSAPDLIMMKHHLEFIESRIDPEKLEKFNETKLGNKIWQGSRYDLNLFKFCLEVHEEVQGNRVLETIENERIAPALNDIQTVNEEVNDIVMNDYLVLEGGWINEIISQDNALHTNDTDTISILDKINVNEDVNFDEVTDKVITCNTGIEEKSNNFSEFEVEMDLMSEGNVGPAERERVEHIYGVAHEMLTDKVDDIVVTNEILHDCNDDDKDIYLDKVTARTVPCYTGVGNESNNNSELGVEIELQNKENNEPIVHVSPDASTKNNVIIPSPFKTILFWPDTQPKKKVSRLKEKIPSVCSSKQWREFYLRKEEEKTKKDNDLKERKRVREENKARKENEKKTKGVGAGGQRKRKKAAESTENNHEENEKCTKIDMSVIKIEEYVIVQYEGEKFPGVIKELKTDSALVSVMALSGINRWKWPSPPDELWYDQDDIVEKIETPKPVTNRNNFCIPEIEKYRKELMHLGQRKKKKAAESTENNSHEEDEKCTKIDMSVIKIGEYVIVQYEGEKFPGVIKELKTDSALVSVMALGGINRWKWPSPPDELWYDQEDIVEKIETPKPVTNRNTFFIPEIEKYH